MALKRAKSKDNVEGTRAKKAKQQLSTKQTAALVNEDKAEVKDSKKSFARIPEDYESRVKARIAIAKLQEYELAKGSKSLFPQIDQALQLSITYKKQPVRNEAGLKRRIILPHYDRTVNNTSICLIMPDLDRSKEGRIDPDVDKQSREWAVKIEDDHRIRVGTHITRIFTKREVERLYNTYKQQRDFATSFDVFLVDSRVAKSVKTFLGKEFHKAHKTPLEIKYDRSLGDSIARALKTVILPIGAFKSRACVPFMGHLSQTATELGENFDAVLDAVVKHCPGGLKNVRNLYIQEPSGDPSLRVYSDEGSANEVKLLKSKSFSRQKEVVDELSTLPDGLEVGVLPSGKIRVIKEDVGGAVLYPTVKDEWEEDDDMRPVLDAEKIEKKKIKKKALIAKKAKKAEMRRNAAKNKKENEKVTLEKEEDDDSDDETDELSAPPTKKAKVVTQAQSSKNGLKKKTTIDSATFNDEDDSDDEDLEVEELAPPAKKLKVAKPVKKTALSKANKNNTCKEDDDAVDNLSLTKKASTAPKFKKANTPLTKKAKVLKIKSKTK